MPYYNQNIFHGGVVDPETISSIIWLIICGTCLVLCISLIITVHLTVIKRYKELKKEDESTKDKSDKTDK